MVKVMVAIDGSDHAIRALEHAANLFGTDAEFVLVSVVPSSMFGSLFGSVPPGTSTQGGTGGSGMPLVPTPEGMASQVESAYEYYRTSQQQAAQSAGVAYVGVIEEARPRKRRIGRAICDAVEEHQAGVVVVGSHGSSYAGEAMLGSVSQYVLFNSSCPVLVSREDHET